MATDKTKFITFHLPTDPELLAAFGLVALSHAHLDHMLRMMIKTFANVTVEEARLATAREGSAAMREMVRKLGRSAMGDGPPFIRLKALLTRCLIVTRRRNALMHGVCAQELNPEAVSDDEIRGATVILNEYLETHPMPKAEELRALAKDIEVLVNQMNDERRFGFIPEAMNAKQQAGLTQR